MNLQGRDFLTLKDYTAEEIAYLLDLAADLKQKKKAGIAHDQQLKGKNVVLIFEKTSTRTRCAFEVAAHDLGSRIQPIWIRRVHRFARRRVFRDTARGYSAGSMTESNIADMGRRS